MYVRKFIPESPVLLNIYYADIMYVNPRVGYWNTEQICRHFRAYRVLWYVFVIVITGQTGPNLTSPLTTRTSYIVRQWLTTGAETGNFS